MVKDSDENKYALIAACTAYHVDKFLWGQIRILQKLGFEVHVAASFDIKLSGNSSGDYIKRCRDRLLQNGVSVFELPFTRFPVSLNNLTAYRVLRKQLKLYPYSLLHCHTPTGGLAARFAAARLRKKGLQVIYTAHGFHFFKGAPLLNWLLFYPAEYCLARVTDKLIVINEEDELAARRMPAKSVVRVNGVGVSREPYINTAPASKSEIGLPPDAFVFLCIGELSKRKNQALLIRGFSVMAKKHPNAVLLLAGEGELRAEYENLVRDMGLTAQVRFLGWRDDIPSLIQMADVVVSSSKQEGLPVNLIEAMLAGKPVIASACRGNRELAEQAGIAVNGEKEFSDAMELLYANNDARHKFGQAALAASSRYEASAVDRVMEEIYESLHSGGERYL